MDEKQSYPGEPYEGDLKDIIGDREWKVRKSRSPVGYVLLKEILEGDFAAIDDNSEMVRTHGVVYPGLHACEAMLRCRFVEKGDCIIQQRCLHGVYIWFLGEFEFNGTRKRTYNPITVPVYTMQKDESGESSVSRQNLDPKKERQQITISIGDDRVTCELVLPKDSMDILFTHPDA